MQKKTIFLASSAELKDDRKEFEIFINRKNNEWNNKGVFLQLIVWEDFLDAIAPTRLQDEYNKAIRESDIFIMLFFTKVGKYTEEEFETAFGQFKATKTPFIFTYFKDAPISTGSASKNDMMSLWAFQEKLKNLEHFQTVYKSIEELQLKFNQQLEKLVANGFIEFNKPSDLEEKNIAKGDIKRVKKIHIGDEGNTSAQNYKRKNIAEGDVSDADSFTLGDRG
jgi:hypothetical protein